MDIVLKESNPEDPFAVNLRRLTGGDIGDCIQQLVHSITSDIARVHSASRSPCGDMTERQEALQALARKATYVMFQNYFLDSLKPALQNLSSYLGNLIQDLLKDGPVYNDWKVLHDFSYGLPYMPYPSSPMSPEVFFSTQLPLFDLLLNSNSLNQAGAGVPAKKGSSRSRKRSVKDPSLTKRKRGRSSKQSTSDLEVPIPKRKPGRPRKYPMLNEFLFRRDKNDLLKYLPSPNQSVQLSSGQDVSSQSGIESVSASLPLTTLETTGTGSNPSLPDLHGGEVVQSFQSAVDVSQPLIEIVPSERDIIITSTGHWT